MDLMLFSEIRQKKNQLGIIYSLLLNTVLLPLHNTKQTLSIHVKNLNTLDLICSGRKMSHL